LLQFYQLRSSLADFSGAVRADQPGPDWMPMEQVNAKALQSGYT
jgi:hypothetical protein